MSVIVTLAKMFQNKNAAAIDRLNFKIGTSGLHQHCRIDNPTVQTLQHAISQFSHAVFNLNKYSWNSSYHLYNKDQIVSGYYIRDDGKDLQSDN